MKAMLTTRKAKWYCWEMEKYLVRDNSRQRVAEETKKIPARKRFFIPDTAFKVNEVSHRCQHQEKQTRNFSLIYDNIGLCEGLWRKNRLKVELGSGLIMISRLRHDLSLTGIHSNKA
ncbi:hypothetical protein ES703_36477 [subsurface metagenome]